MACKLPGYVGREVALEYMLACGDVDPRDPNTVWNKIGRLTTKDFNLTWETADMSTDATVGSLRENIATWQTLEISGSGTSTPRDDATSNLTALTKHQLNPGEEFSGQPVAWIRMTFPDLTFISYMLITQLNRQNPSDGAATFDITLSATASDFGLIVLDTPTGDEPDAESVTVSYEYPSAANVLYVGSTMPMSASVLPSGAIQTVLWSSSDPDIVSVHPVTGEARGVSLGSATITATSIEDSSVFDSVVIDAAPLPQSLELTASGPTTFYEGDTLQLSSVVLPTGSSQDVTYYSSDELVAYVDASGLVTGVSAGVATITAQSDSRPTVYADIEVTVEPQELEVSPEGPIEIDEGDTQQLSASIVPSHADQSVTYASSDDLVATVDSGGLIEAISEGTAVITVTSVSRPDLFVEVTVQVSASG